MILEGSCCLSSTNFGNCHSWRGTRPQCLQRLARGKLEPQWNYLIRYIGRLTTVCFADASWNRRRRPTRDRDPSSLIHACYLVDHPPPQEGVMQTVMLASRLRPPYHSLVLDLIVEPTNSIYGSTTCKRRVSGIPAPAIECKS